MLDRNDISCSLIRPATIQACNPPFDGVRGSEFGRGMPVFEAERMRLEDEREKCQASLQRLDADLRNLEAERALLQDAVEPDAVARLRLLADMSVDLRTALHGILGYVQLFRVRGGLDPVQTEWVNAMLAAGAQLLGKVQCVVRVADIDAEPNAWLTDSGDLAPDAPAGTASAEPAATHNDRPGLPDTGAQTALHVLIADDDTMNREVAASFARAAGHRVVVVETGAKAVLAAGSNDFDVILMDVCMPHIDGLEASRRIRAISGARGRVPIIALTARTYGDGIQACRTAGMNGHLAKPFRFDTLQKAILEAAARGNHGPDAVPYKTGFSSAASAPRGRHDASNAGALESPQHHAQEPPWIDIACAWNSAPSGGVASSPHSTGTYVIDTQYKVSFTAVGSRYGRRLVVGSVRSCAPPPERARHEYHWLLYADPAPPGVGAYTATCDLWRWSGSAWHSLAVPGANFSPDEMFEQGWRYCGPCFERTAMVEII